MVKENEVAAVMLVIGWVLTVTAQLMGSLQMLASGVTFISGAMCLLFINIYDTRLKKLENRETRRGLMVQRIYARLDHLHEGLHKLEDAKKKKG